MTAQIVDELDPPFEVAEPVMLSGPVVCNSPHSGRVYPSAFLLTSRLDLATLRRSEDRPAVEDVVGVRVDHVGREQRAIHVEESTPVPAPGRAVTHAGGP